MCFIVVLSSLFTTRRARTHHPLFSELRSDTDPTVKAEQYVLQQCIHKLEESNFQNIRPLIDDKKLNFLGICLGMQILFDDSSEGNKRGLGLLEGSVRKLTDRFYDDEYISTNVGWRKVIFEQQEKFSQFNDNFFYFVHQYEAVPKNENDIIAYTQKFNKNIVAAVKKENICGIQFHPEKSGQNGIRFLNSLIKGFYE